MSEAITNVERELGECDVNKVLRAMRTNDSQGAGNGVHNPVRRDHVVEVTNVIAVQMRQNDA